MNLSLLLTILLFLGLLRALVVLARLTPRQSPSAGKPGEPEASSSQFNFPADFGPILTGRRLGRTRWLIALLVIAAFGLHAYWALFATGPLRVDPAFAGLKDRRDQRNRRESESLLRGWIYDRHGDSRHALAKYRYLNGQVIRDYPLGPAASHLVGFGTLVRGDAWLEKAVAPRPPLPSSTGWWESMLSLVRETPPPPLGPDLRTTIDADLQREAWSQISDRQAAVVLLDPQSGEILAMASSPGYDPAHVEIDDRWKALVEDGRTKPLLNRVIGEYYLPGSTLKTMTAAAAIDARLDNLTFTCRAEGWTPPGSGRPIRDDEGESHGTIGLSDAFAYSCNQYFAQLGVELDRQRMAEAADRFGFRVFSNPADSIGSGRQDNLWNTGNRLVSSVLAPVNSTFVSGRGITRYDLALESIGQGYVQSTPLQMALVAAAAANARGMVPRPTIEAGRQPTYLSQAMSAPTASRMRQLMAGVVRRGTASATFGTRLAGLTAGGKTGTAQRQVTVFDPLTGRPVFDRDSRGRERPRKELRIDSWFIGFAPLDNPRIAFAVVVEAGGYGARTSAPIAANLLRRARQLGLL